MQISNNLCQVMTRYFLVIGNWLISKLLWIAAGLYPWRLSIHATKTYTNCHSLYVAILPIMLQAETD